MGIDGFDDFDRVMAFITKALQSYNESFGETPEVVYVNFDDYYDLTEFTGANQPTVALVPVEPREYVNKGTVFAKGPKGMWEWRDQ